MRIEGNWVGWYYRRGQQRIGPVPREQIARLVVGGQLRPTDAVWKAWSDGDEFRFFPTEAEDAVLERVNRLNNETLPLSSSRWPRLEPSAS